MMNGPRIKSSQPCPGPVKNSIYKPKNYAKDNYKNTPAEGAGSPSVPSFPEGKAAKNARKEGYQMTLRIYTMAPTLASSWNIVGAEDTSDLCL